MVAKVDPARRSEKTCGEESLKEGDLERIVHEAMEDAAMHGLCLEGRIEMAANKVRHYRPDWTVEAAFSFVTDVIGLH